MAPFSASKSTQICPKLGPEGQSKDDCFFDYFLIVFSSIFGPKLGPCWAQVGTKIGSPANPEPTLGRPCPFLTPSRWLWDLQSSLWVSQTFQKEAKSSKMDPRPPQNPPK